LPNATTYVSRMSKAGIVTVAGKPNVGKSTMLNRIVGQKLSITSEKPQSTRDRIVGIRTTDDTQMILLDTPGLLEPRYELQRVMRSTAVHALADADVIVYVTDATLGPAPSFEEAASLEKSPRAPVIPVLNKIDRVSQEERDRLVAYSPDAIPLSALTGEGIDLLLSRISTYLPESPFLYPEDDISTQSMRFFTAELIRETALEQLSEEVPYSVACEIEEFREDRSPVYIRATIYVERDSQKRILIGEKGARIRDLGRAARAKIERFIGGAVYLDLWVKVLANWRRDARALERFGYRMPQEPAQ
jgi:GTP-binding protein Era